MKICRISQTYPTSSNGGKGLHTYFTSNLIKVDTLILTKFYRENYFNPSNHVKLVPIKYWQEPFPENRKYFIRYLLAILSYIVGQFQFLFKSIKHLNKFKPNIVHLQSPHAFLIGWYCKLVFKSKVVITFHGSDLRRIKNNKIYKKLLNRFDNFFYVSKSMIDDLSLSFGEQKLMFTPSGVDYSFFRIDEESIVRQPILLAVGNIRWQKGYNYLVEAFEKVVLKFPAYSLIIIGGGEQKEIKKLENLISSKGLESKVILKGYQKRGTIKEYLTKSKLFVMSSVSEGMPKVIHEALCSKLPIVCTDVGECKELVGESGIVVPKKSPEELSIAICNILRDENLYQSLQESIADNVKKYSWDLLSRNIYERFLEL